LSAEAQRPLSEHIDAFQLKMQTAGRSTKHIERTVNFCKQTAEAAGFKTAADVTADAVHKVAGSLSERWAARTVAARLQAIKSLTRWLWREGKLAADPLAGVLKPNPKADRRRERRMLLQEEWTWLRSVTLAENEEREGMPAAERVLLYAVAVQTGLRASELRILTRRRLFLDNGRPFITCPGAGTKNRKDARQYIRRETAAELAAHIATKTPGAPVFAMPTEYDTADMLRDDLAAARAAWIDAAKSDPQEHLRREQSDFLAAVNHEREHIDFHSLRHTCGAWLAIAGVHPNIIKTVMRHSVITLTMDTYGHLMPDDTADAIDKLPNMTAGEPIGLKVAGATG
ncbi:MAG: site-specific integrase, partial [Thermoguttaceae bacterium]|nr:site-specific integrase [Thermoguttaceae bacterium]